MGNPCSVVYQRILISAILLWQVMIFPGCFYIGMDNYDDIMQKPSTEWSVQESITVLISCTEHNLYDPTNTTIKVFVTPYYPSVILASERAWYDRRHFTEQEFKSSAEELARVNAGLYIDWQKNLFVDGRGNYFRGPLQLDSLMFMIYMEKQFSPFYLPYIGDLEQHIYLVNDKDKYIRPRYVWGRRQNLFVMPERLLAMFPLRNEGHHFLEGSEKMYLIIKGFYSDIKLTFDLSKIR